MTRLLLLNKPFDVLCQFTGGKAAEGKAAEGEVTEDAGRRTLADFVSTPDVYPAGRLDRDSEGLVLLTDDGRLQHRLADPSFKLPKRYLVQLDGDIGTEALEALRGGPTLADGPTRTLEALRVEPPAWLWARDPPVRYRRAIPTSWIEIVIAAGRNRQVRRMTAAVGHPTLRLVRLAVGPFRVEGLTPGEVREADAALLPAVPEASAPGRPRRRSAPRRRGRRGGPP